MKLSIITINMNNRDGLKKTIDSVMSQTFNDFEWIVIDGGSDDGSRNLIEKYASHFSYWVSEADNGIYNAMNKGIAHAKGDYLQFLNSGDCFCSSTALSDIFMNDYGEDILYADVHKCMGDVRVGDFVYPDKLSLLRLYEQNISHNFSFIRRTLLMENPYSEKYQLSSDWLFFMEAAIANKSFRHIPVFIGCYDMSGRSSTDKQIIETERRGCTERLMPKMLVLDSELRQKVEKHLAYVPIESFLVLADKYRFLSWLIKRLVYFMLFLEKFHFLRARLQ